MRCQETGKGPVSREPGHGQPKRGIDDGNPSMTYQSSKIKGPMNVKLKLRTLMQGAMVKTIVSDVPPFEKAGIFARPMRAVFLKQKKPGIFITLRQKGIVLKAGITFVDSHVHLDLLYKTEPSRISQLRRAGCLPVSWAFGQGIQSTGDLETYLHNQAGTIEKINREFLPCFFLSGFQCFHDNFQGAFNKLCGSLHRAVAQFHT